MAATSIDRYGSYYSPSRFLESAEALVGEGMQAGLQTVKTTAIQAGSAFLTGSLMETLGDKANIGGFPGDVAAGVVVTLGGVVGSNWLGEDNAQYVTAAGTGILAAAAGRLGREAAIWRRNEAAKARASAKP